MKNIGGDGNISLLSTVLAMVYLRSDQSSLDSHSFHAAHQKKVRAYQVIREYLLLQIRMAQEDLLEGSGLNPER